MRTIDGTPTIREASARARTLAAAGILGPVLFTVGVVVQELVRGGRYDRISQLISDLTAGPYGWMQQVNFIVLGLLMITFAVGLQLGIRPAQTQLTGPVILGGNGLGLVVAGIFPLREDAAGLVYDPLGVHTVNGALFFLSIGVAFAALSRRLGADPRWRDLSFYTLATGIILFVLFIVVAALARPTQAPLHDWLGLMQRLAVAVWFACIVTLALRLRRVAAITDHRRQLGLGNT